MQQQGTTQPKGRGVRRRWRPLVLGLVTASVILAASPLRAESYDEVVEEFFRNYSGILNKETSLGVTDGNPLAGTAFMAKSAYTHYGLTPRMSTKPTVDEDRWMFDLTIGGGMFESGRVDGYYTTAEIEFAYRFSDTLTASLLLPVQYRNAKRTDTFTGGFELGLPIALIPDRGEGLSWLLTPSGTLAGAGVSIELVQGGYFFGGNLVSSLAWQSGPLTLVMANQITYDWGRPIGFERAFNVEQEISQPILKNGVKVAYAFGHTVSVDLGITYTNLLNGAFVDNYWTPTAGLTVRFGRDTGLRIGYTGDYADNFKSYGGEAEFYVSF